MRIVLPLLFLGITCLLGLAEVSKRLVSIQVDDVKLAEAALPDKPAREFMNLSSGDPIEAFSEVGNQRWIKNRISSGHPFVVAVHQAYVDHRPLVLSPDVIWTLLIQMAAKEVNGNPGRFRTHFTDQQNGKETIGVRRNEFQMGAPSNDWASVFAELEERMIGKTDMRLTRLFSHGFASSRDSEIAARRVVLLGAASPFFDYRVATLCGIPHVKLKGEVTDWEWIRANAPSLAVFNMKKRTAALLPVLDEFVAASKGKANKDFWKRIYHLSHECRGDEARGWFGLFLMEEDHRNLKKVLEKDFSWLSVPFEGNEMYTGDFPSPLNMSRLTKTGVTMVDFNWEYLGKTLPMRGRAGFLGVAQDRETLALEPVIGWQVLRARLTAHERDLANFVERMTLLSYTPMQAITNHFKLNVESGRIERESGGAGLPDGEGRGKEFWEAALKMMVSLEEIHLSSWQHCEPLMNLEEIVTLFGTVPSLKVIHVQKDTEKEMLEGLKKVPRWEIRMKE